MVMAFGLNFLALAASALCWCVVESCGVLVHNEILHRSTHLFALPNSTPDLTSLTPLISPLLTSAVHAPSLQAGAFFPDWGYQCLSTDASAEAAHWPPFLVASVEHIVSKYGYLNDTLSRSVEEQEHLEGLIAFIFAISAHQTSDATWHAIRLPTGFLAVLAGVDFEGDISRAHRVLDFGGDFILAARLARMDPASRNWIGDEWRVPVKDLVAIYQRIGRDVNPFVLRYCTMRGLAALQSDLAVGPSLYDSFVSQSPMLLASIDSYHLGGIDEMSARTVACWSNLTRWFAHGIERDEKLRDGWGICDVFQAIKARGGAGDSSRATSRQHSLWGVGAMLRRSKREFARIQIQTDRFGAEIYTLPAHDEGLSHSAAPSLHRQVLLNNVPKFQDPTYIATYVPYSHFGASLAYGNFSPSGPALAVGAPHETEDSARPSAGNVYILPLSDFPAPSDATQPISVSSSATQLSAVPENGVTDQRFGTSVTAVRALNTTLLAVAAPGPYTYDSGTPPSLPFQGAAAAGRIDLFRPGEPTRFLSVRVRGAEMGSIGRRWWGRAMISVDLGSPGEFLVVSGSRSDGIRVCEGREKVQLGEGEVGVFQLVSTSGSTTTDGGVLELELGDNVTTSDATITINSWRILLPPFQKTDIPCSKTDTYENFGHALSHLPTSHTLLISAPGASGGKVYGYTLASNTFTHVFTIPSPQVSALRTGFGAALAAGTVHGCEWIAVAAPDEGVDGEPQVGVVRVYAIVAGVSRPRLVAEVVPAGGRKRRFSKFGRTLVAAEGGVWVGSEFWDGERGAVWWVDVGRWIQDGEVARGEVRTVWEGTEVNARFATGLAVGAGGEVFVGVPYAGVGSEVQDMRFYGAVAVFRR